MKLIASGGWPLHRMASGCFDLISDRTEEKSESFSRYCESDTISSPAFFRISRVPLATDTSKESSAATSDTVFALGSSLVIISMVLEKQSSAGGSVPKMYL